MKVKFILAVLVQVLVLIAMMGYRYYWVSTGERVVLKPIPVDPRSLFRGDYARLRYEINSIEFEDPDTAPTFHRNERVYVELHKNENGIWSGMKAQKLRPDSWPYIQGRVKNYYERTQKRFVTLRGEDGEIHVLQASWFNMEKGTHAAFCVRGGDRILAQHNLDQNVIPEKWCDRGTIVSGTVEEIKAKDYNRMEIVYGIESYFVEEGMGRKVEQQGRDESILVEVALLDGGQATIARLISKGPDQEINP